MKFTFFCSLAACLLLTAGARAADGLDELKQLLPLLGHRNWIVVTDAAYPLQTSPGIVTLRAEGRQEEVVRGVKKLLDVQEHVRPVVYLDKELDFVGEDAAAGITAYRKGIASILSASSPLKLPHEDLIAKLDKAGASFRIVIIKTPGTLPYSSVFFELDCAYWSAANERVVRDAMQAHDPS